MSKKGIDKESSCVELTRAETSVMEAILEIGEPLEVPGHLNISSNTLETHLRNIRAKLNVRSTVHALVVYIKSISNSSSHSS